MPSLCPPLQALSRLQVLLCLPKTIFRWSQSCVWMHPSKGRPIVCDQTGKEHFTTTNVTGSNRTPFAALSLHESPRFSDVGDTIWSKAKLSGLTLTEPQKSQLSSDSFAKRSGRQWKPRWYNVVENLIAGTNWSRRRLTQRPGPASNLPSCSVWWISGAGKANTPSIPLWPIPRLPQAMTHGTGPPTNPKTSRPSRHTISRNPSRLTRPPIRSIGRSSKQRGRESNSWDELVGNSIAPLNRGQGSSSGWCRDQQFTQLDLTKTYHLMLICKINGWKTVRRPLLPPRQ